MSHSISRRKTFLAATSIAFLIFPVLASAALPTNLHDGRPKKFEFQAYVESSGTNVTASISGEFEGSKPANTKAKIFLSAHIKRDQAWANIDARVVLSGGNAYVRLDKVEGSIEADAALRGMSAAGGMWHRMPISQAWFDALGPLNRGDSGTLTVDGDQYGAGRTYQASSDTLGNNFAAEVLQELSFGLFPDLSGDAKTVLKLKLDLSPEREFRFARLWLGIDHALAGISLRFSGKTERIFHTVYIKTPTDYKDGTNLREILPIDWFALSRPDQTMLTPEPSPERLNPVSTGSASSAPRTFPGRRTAPEPIAEAPSTSKYVPSYGESFSDFARTRRRMPSEAAPATSRIRIVDEPETEGPHEARKRLLRNRLFGQ